MTKWINMFKGKEEAKVTKQNYDKTIPIYHDYGLGMLNFALQSGDYGQHIRTFKKVKLVNVSECKNKVSVFGLVSAWRGTGHMEWEYLLAGFFIGSLLEAIENNEEEADITCLFDRDLTASGQKIFTQSQIYDHLMDWFDIISETNEELKLVLKLKN